MNRQIINSRSSGKTQKLHCNLFFRALLRPPVSEDWMDITQVTSVNVNVSEKETKLFCFDRPKTVIFLNFSRAYKKYIGYVYSPLGGQYLSYKDMKNLLQGSMYYIGETKAKRIGKEVHRCFIFDLTLIFGDFSEVHRSFEESYHKPEVFSYPVRKFIESEEELQKAYYPHPSVVTELLRMKSMYDHKSKELKEAIETLQNICSHKFETKETTPHYTIEQCIHCQKQRNI